MFLAKVRLVFLPLNESKQTPHHFSVWFLLRESNGSGRDYSEYLFADPSSWENDCAFARKLLLRFGKLRV